jgi:hypothetical protein
VSFDFNQLRTDLKRATQAAIVELRASHPDEDFYAFALYTDDGVAGVSPAANTEEAFAEAVGRYKFKDPRENAYVRWATGEWKYQGFGTEHFKRGYDAIASMRHADDEAFARFRRQILDLMVAVLGELDAGGLFGSGPERDRVTLLCSVTDADSSGEAFQKQSIRFLNPPAVIAAYEASWAQANAPRVNIGPACPKCGQPLRTPKAQQCFLCGAKWHGLAGESRT